MYSIGCASFDSGTWMVERFLDMRQVPGEVLSKVAQRALLVVIVVTMERRA